MKLRQALILAAGLGTRLRPLTTGRPKALVSCAGRPLLAYVIDQVIAAGCVHIVINVHYFAEQVMAYVAALNLPGIEFYISDETAEIKDTGGALVHALPHLLPERPVLICNTDILTNLPLEAVYSAHEASGRAATLLVQQRDSSRKLCFDNDMLLQGWVNTVTGEQLGKVLPDKHNHRAFAGIHVIEPALIRAFRDRYGEQPFPVVRAYLQSLDAFSIGGYEAPAGNWWMDCGTAEKLEAAERWLDKKAKQQDFLP